MKRKKQSFGVRLGKDIRRYYDVYLLVIPVILFYFLFCYKPMYGVLIAFKDFKAVKGILGSPWTSSFGFRHFIDFFDSYYFARLLKNTLVISLTSIVIGFPMPIIFALMLNELKSTKFKKVVQTISYMPHFISLVVACGMVRMFVSETGIVTQFLSLITGHEITRSLLSNSNAFVPIYVLSGVWQELGWGAIIYLSALAGVDQQLYEAAIIDGAGRWKQLVHVTLPGISGAIIIMFLMRIGNVMNVGYEKIILLYNEGIYETADIISSFVYRKGLLNFEWSYSTAVSLFNSVINLVIILVFNKISKKVTEVGLW